MASMDHLRCSIWVQISPVKASSLCVPLYGMHCGADLIDLTSFKGAAGVWECIPGSHVAPSTLIRIRWRSLKGRKGKGGNWRGGERGGMGHPRQRHLKEGSANSSAKPAQLQPTKVTDGMYDCVHSVHHMNHKIWFMADWSKLYMEWCYDNSQVFLRIVLHFRW